MKPLLVLSLSLFCASPVFAQGPLAGKWSTESVVPAQNSTARGSDKQAADDNIAQLDRRVDPVTGQVSIANPFDPTGKSRLVKVDSSAKVEAPKTEIKLDLTVAGTKISGTATETSLGGPVAIQDGVVTGNRFSFKTLHTTERGPLQSVWKGEFLDANTIVLAHVTSRVDARVEVSPQAKARGAKEAPVFFGTPRDLPDDVKQTAGARVLHRVD